MYDDRPVGGAVDIDFTVDVEEIFTNLSVEQLVVHHNWKARKVGYEKVRDDPKRYKADLLINIKKVCSESNAPSLENLMEAFCAITPLSTPDELDLLCKEPLSITVEKGITGRPKAIRSAELFISSLVERGRDVFQTLIPYFSYRIKKNKQAAVHTCTILVNEFGADNFPIKNILKATIPCFSDASPDVRREAASLCCEIYRHIGESIKVHLNGIRESQLQDLEKQFDEIGVGNTQEPKKKIEGAPVAKRTAPISDKDRNGDISDERFNQLDECPVLSRLPKDFFAKALNKSVAWQDRCSLVNDTLMPLLSLPRLKRDNYHELASFMREYLVDPQAPPMLLGFKMIQECARGMRSDFNPHARGYLHVLFDKMKDKKTSVQEHVYTTLEKLIVFHCVSLDQCLDEIELTTLSKNPSQRLSLINFCIRIIDKIDPTDIGKLAISYPVLERMINDEKLENRETGYILVSKLISMFGEEPYNSLVDTMEEKQKARFFGCLSQVRGKKLPSKTPSSSPAKKVIRLEEKTASSLGGPQEMDSIPKMASMQRDSQTRNSSHSKPLKHIVNPDDAISMEGTLPKKDYVVNTMLGLSGGDSDLLDLLRSNEWSRRCEGVERVRAISSLWSPGQCTEYFNVLLVYFRFYPGLKETTIQVFQAMRTVIQDVMYRAAVISQGAAYVLVSEYTPRLTEPKNKNAVRDTCSFLAERFGPRFVIRHMITVATQVHTPKLIVEVNEFITELIREYPAKRITSAPLDLKGIMEYIKSPCLDHTSVTVRQPTVHLLTEVRRHAGSCVDEYVESFPPAVQSIYEQEFDRKASTHSGMPNSAISPSSKRFRSSSCQSFQSTQGKKVSGRDGGAVSPALPFEEFKALMKAVTTELDWKKRLDAVQKLENLLMVHTEVLPGLLTEHLLKALSTRFTETNRNFVVEVLRVIPLVVEKSDPNASRNALTKHVLTAVVCMLGDQKSTLREEARNVSNIGMNIVGLESMIQPLTKPLNSDSNICRQNVLELLLCGFRQLPDEAILPRNRLAQLVPGITTALMDRIQDVRVLAEQVTGYMIRYIGSDPFFRHIFQLKPAEQNIVTPVVERQFQLNSSTGDCHLNSTVSTEPEEMHSRLPSERISASARDRSSGRSSMPRESLSSRRSANDKERVPYKGSRGHESSTFFRSATALELPRPPHSSRGATPAAVDESLMYSVQEIQSGLRTADSHIGCSMCVAFRKHLETGVDCCSSEMVQVMVDRLSRSTVHMEETLALQICQCLSSMFLNSRSSHKYQKTFLFNTLGTLFNCLLSEQFIGNATVLKALNNMVLKLLEGCLADEIFGALLSCLTSYSTTYLQTGRKEDLKYVQVTVKCIMRHNIQNVSPENVVLCCHEYLLQHPPSTFRDMDDLPVRTVKTILQTATRQYGSQVLPLSVRLIGPENLVTHFIRACLDTKEKAEDNERHAREESQKQTRASLSGHTPTKTPISGAASTQGNTHVDPDALLSTRNLKTSVPLSAPPPECSASSPASRTPGAAAPPMTLMFNKIRNYQTSTEGIDELFAHLQRHGSASTAEFDLHFNRCSEPFRFFIKRRLERKVAEDKSSNRVALPKSITSLQ